MQKGPRTHVRRLVWIAAGIVAISWIAESAIDAFVDREATFVERLIPLNDASAVWSRLVLVVSLLVLLAYIQFILIKFWKAQETLRESEERYRNLFEHANDSIFIADPETHHLLDVNANAAKRLGYTREELLRLRMDDLDSPATAALTKGTIREVLEGSSVIVEREHIRKDGTVMPVELSCRLVEYNGRRALQAFARDISDRKQMEEQVSRAQRLEMAAGIAGQVAHDFNNLLSPLVGYSQLIKRQLSEGHPAAKYCDIMVSSARQMADINEDLLTLSRRGHVNFELMDLNGLIQQVVAQSAPLPEGLKLEPDLAENLLPVSGSPAQLLRVVLNLVSNAKEAISEAGQIKIKTENVYIDKPFGRYNRVEKGEYVRLQISDNGSGIPPENRDKIFDPFFTTKRADRRAGTGLGLTIVHVIVGDHNGYLDLESEVGKGTTFRIYLPVERQRAEQEQSDRCEGGSESLLVVDDDEVQRELLRQLLTTLGYRVSSVSRGEEAVAYLRKQPVDLLMLDMVLSPGIDGAETYRQALAVRPGQKAIILSGYAESDRVREAQASGAGAYIRKPVTLTALARAVRQELDRT